MKRLKLLSAAAVLSAMLPLATASTSLAQGPGPCTPPGNSAVGAAGPAMNSGQLMAGVGQCQPIGSWHNAYNYNAYNYWDGGYRRPGLRTRYYGGPGYYGGPTYYGGPGYGYGGR